MSSLIEFLTSQEIMVVYIVSGLACLLCFGIYLIEKNNEKLRRRHNTRELNKLVEKVKKEIPTREEPVIYQEPVLEEIESTNEASSVVELLESTAEMQKIEDKKNSDIKPLETKEEVLEPIIIDSINNVIQEVEKNNINDTENKDTLNTSSMEVEKQEEELEYTSIEPDQATAKLELQKLTEELKKQEELAENNNISLTNYEEEQEENAIISLEELVKKSKEMYAANELTQYADEGNEPISLQDLEKKMGEKQNSYNEPFIIANVVPETELKEETENVSITNNVRETIQLQDFNTIGTKEAKVVKEPTKKFQSSPIISPIYGIEKKNSSNNELELENTANYDKLDEEIKKTNEFLMTLKELQKKLD